MEFQLYGRDGAFPCEVTIDDDNGRYMIRKEDTSGEVFNSTAEMYLWMRQHWKAEDFHEPELYMLMMQEVQKLTKRNE
ncbi:hypothetical protein ACFFGV_04535 [Pontibacillus salicampi]|uniref:Threonine dehydratase n=1 Tax=Pontibacillus salicampi TaxID=1449801 RepID=A0ABV6LKK3_9BACI